VQFALCLKFVILHYVDNVETTISLLKGKLKNDGLMYVGQIVVPDKKSEIWHDKLIQSISNNRKRSFVCEEFVELFKNNGFIVNKYVTTDYEENIKNFFRRRNNDNISYEQLLNQMNEALNNDVTDIMKVKVTQDNLFFTVKFCHLLLSKG